MFHAKIPDYRAVDEWLDPGYNIDPQYTALSLEVGTRDISWKDIV